VYEAGSHSSNDSLWKDARSNSGLDHVEQAYAVGAGILIKKLMNSKQ
jgi:hypothetical protein